MKRPAVTAAAEERIAFWLFPQPPYVPGYEQPELVFVRTLDFVGTGPSDARMYVADAFDKALPYDFPYLPPYETGQLAPVRPDRRQGFAIYRPGSQAFLATHLFGSVAWLMEIWEGYLGRPVPWHFHNERLELVPFVDWDNAQAGYGFLETGYGQAPDGTLWPFALSFDVIAHEVGHLLLYSLLGLPQDGEPSPAFGAFHEGASDLLALIGLLHFDSAVERILRRSGGNLYLDNELNRFGELSASGEIRSLVNPLTLADLTAGDTLHRRSQVLSGAFYDILVEAYALGLVREGVLDRADLATLRLAGVSGRSDRDGAQAAVAGKIAATGLASGAAARALRRARDFVGRRLLAALGYLDPDEITFGRAAAAFLAADLALSGDDRNQDWIASSFLWRGIRPPRPQTLVVLPAAARRRGTAFRRIPGYPEPHEFQHRCGVRGRRCGHPLAEEVSHVFE